jgi:hypothetical protein
VLRDAFLAFASFMNGNTPVTSSDAFAERLGAYDQMAVMLLITSTGSTDGEVRFGVEHSSDGVHWTSYGAGFRTQLYTAGTTTLYWYNMYPEDQPPPQRYVRFFFTQPDGLPPVWVELSVALRDLDWVSEWHFEPPVLDHVGDDGASS